MRLMLLLCVCVSACSVRTGTPPDSGGGGGDGGGWDAGVAPGEDGGRPPPRDGGFVDPFDPANGCGASTIQTERVPGSLLLVFDRSGSMADPANGDSGPSKWDLAVSAINNVMSSVSDELSAGLILFPSPDDCSVDLPGGVPHVPVAPMPTSRPMISAALETADPTGSSTPMFRAARAGWAYLRDSLDSPGQEGIVLVTDGADTCDSGDGAAVQMEAATMLEDHNILTFVVGLDHSNNDLSGLAYYGGTPRNDTCMPECTSDLCMSDADCPGTMPGRCDTSFGGFGFCACASDADCVAPQTCEAPCGPFPCPVPNMCAGDANCCHYNATADNFQMEFESALDVIAQRFLDSCVFEVPRGTDPSMFDPNLVNVGVTFTGEMRTVLRQSSDASMSSWAYTDGTHRSIVIQGPICERLLMGDAVVEIVLGCPTILI